MLNNLADQNKNIVSKGIANRNFISYELGVGMTPQTTTTGYLTTTNTTNAANTYTASSLLNSGASQGS